MTEEKEIKNYRQKLNDVKMRIEGLVRLQSSQGNYNRNEYMWGFANGLILALSCITDKPLEYIKKPEKWLDDLPNVDSKLDRIQQMQNIDGNGFETRHTSPDSKAWYR